MNDFPKNQPQQLSNKQTTQQPAVSQAAQKPKESPSNGNGVTAIARKSTVVPSSEPSLVLTAAEPISNGQPTILGQVLIPIPLPARPKSPPFLVAKKGFAQFQIDYPLIGDWTSEQVANFFKALGYDKEAPVFIEQVSSTLFQSIAESDRSQDFLRWVSRSIEDSQAQNLVLNSLFPGDRWTLPVVAQPQ